MERIITPKRVADQHRHAVTAKWLRNVRHWGHASELIYSAEVPVDVVFLERGPMLYQCQWRGAWVATYCLETQELALYLPDLLERAVELMTATEQMRHREKLPDIDVVQKIRKPYTGGEPKKKPGD